MRRLIDQQSSSSPLSLVGLAGITLIRGCGTKRVLELQGKASHRPGSGDQRRGAFERTVLLNNFSSSLNPSRAHSALLSTVCLESWTLVSLFPCFLGCTENRRQAFASTAIVVIGCFHLYHHQLRFASCSTHIPPATLPFYSFPLAAARECFTLFSYTRFVR
jgi:hypothetical protein